EMALHYVTFLHRDLDYRLYDPVSLSTHPATGKSATVRTSLSILGTNNLARISSNDHGDLTTVVLAKENAAEVVVALAARMESLNGLGVAKGKRLSPVAFEPLTKMKRLELLDVSESTLQDSHLPAIAAIRQ